MNNLEQARAESPLMRKSDRVIKLKIIDGEKGLDKNGQVDPRLLNGGGNDLHAVMDPQTCLWTLHFEKGMIPMPLRQQFTSFSMTKKHVEAYYRGRNIEIAEVQD